MAIPRKHLAFDNCIGQAICIRPLQNNLQDMSHVDDEESKPSEDCVKERCLICMTDIPVTILLKHLDTHKTLKSLTKSECRSTATDVEEIENEPPVSNIAIQSSVFSASMQDDETASRLHTFTQTPKNLTPRRNVGIQTDILLEESHLKPTTWEIETQTDLVLCDIEEADDLNCSFISNSSDPDWTPLVEKQELNQLNQLKKENL
ncbi:hypothetical protein LOTGIDRAFT_162006 [Lottia gigantea]|uniref:Uncharacterized protein n=1 Tax=Lottia gigantea TaxID=225164 RepID=V4BVD5_LOTGI|nr:hypothetical protein LOTGIDRAFT_162006 [Lottia gigantea]ESO92979.1 hypothetical protein LOTGIDRAFT_162006 [Lottia gigantea]